MAPSQMPVIGSEDDSGSPADDGECDSEQSNGVPTSRPLIERLRGSVNGSEGSREEEV